MPRRRAVPRCALCGRVINAREKTPTIERLDGRKYSFDTGDCALMFKKFRSVYGKTFFR